MNIIIGIMILLILTGVIAFIYSALLINELVDTKTIDAEKLDLFIEELKFNQNINKAKELENRINIDYVIERLEDIK